MATRRKKVTQGNKITRNFDAAFQSINELQTFVNALPVSTECSDYLVKFCNETTKQDIETKINCGCESFTTKFMEAKSNVMYSGGESINEDFFDVCGLYFNIDEAIEGNPMCWINTISSSAVKFYDIKINITAPQLATDNQIFNKLVSLVKLIDKIESEGNRVKLTLCLTGKSSYNNTYNSLVDISVMVKNYSEVIVLEPLIYVIASPVMLRYYMLMITANLVGESSKGAYIIADNEPLTHSDGENVYIQSMYKDLEKGMRWNEPTDICI